MTLAQAIPIDAWADSAYLEAGCNMPPIDLHAVARWRFVKCIKTRLMVHDGALVPVPGGFEVYLFDLKQRDVDVRNTEPLDAYSVRQRFTLAHEVAHTRFYKTEGSIPVPTGRAKPYGDKDGIGLEKLCDRAAARFLVPSLLLKKEIRETLSNRCERIDVPFVRLLVEKFRVSFDVMIERLRSVEPDNTFARSLIHVCKRDGVHQIRASYTGVPLFSLVSPPSDHQYKSVRNWLPELPRAITERPELGDYQITVRGRKLSIRQYPIGRRGDFLLQIDDPLSRAPDSN